MTSTVTLQNLTEIRIDCDTDPSTVRPLRVNLRMCILQKQEPVLAQVLGAEPFVKGFNWGFALSTRDYSWLRWSPLSSVALEELE